MSLRISASATANICCKKSGAAGLLQSLGGEAGLGNIAQVSSLGHGDTGVVDEYIIETCARSPSENGLLLAPSVANTIFKM
jgi:hypothetical protein